MERFEDQPLRRRPHLAVLFKDQLGDFVCATPLLRGLKEKYAGATIDYFGGERTRELEEACPYLDARFSLYGPPAALRDLPGFVGRRVQEAGTYDLAINLDFSPVNAVAVPLLDPRYVVGRAFEPDGRRELPGGSSKLDRLQDPATVWASDSFLNQFGDVLQSNFIGEIFCRMARVETDFNRCEVPREPPPLEIPDVLIATGGTRSAKLWPFSYWRRLIENCDGAGLSVGLLGAAPKVQKTYGSAGGEEQLLQDTTLIDLRGKLTLPQVAGALARARAAVSIDNGIMHLACAVGTPTVALFGASPWDLWAPRVKSLALALPSESCTLCRENRYLNDGCLRERHICMESITPEEVFRRLTACIRPPQGVTR